ncbi:MAG: hypothetical protein GF350_16670 [Chitinivibrionales bacterium]|nr:hypothetical protein [Chitinivibrionales bacterium]
MSRRKSFLINRALSDYKIIYPCANRLLKDCFTIHKGCLIFWFNTTDGSTHIIDERTFLLKKVSGCN